MDRMDVTVLGAGVVGTNLGVRLGELGHRVRFGARDVSSPKVLAALDRVRGATSVPLDAAAEGTDLLVLAVPYGAVDDTLDAIGDPGRAIVVDATNAVGVPLVDGVSSIVDQIHRHFPSASVVKAFNTVGAEWYLDPTVDGRSVFLPVAGPSAPAELVAGLAREMGFDAMVIGDVDLAPLLERQADLWIHLAFRVGFGRDFAFVRVDR